MTKSAERELSDERRAMLLTQMGRLSRRAVYLRLALTNFYISASIFVLTSLAIGVVSFFSLRWAYLPVVTAIVGGCFLLFGSVSLILEARLAVRNLHAEMEFLGRVVRYYAERQITTAPPA